MASKIRCTGSTNVKSVLVPKARYSRAQANAWAKDHDMRATCKPVGKGRFWHCPQKRGRVVGTIHMGRSGIIARVGCK